MFKSVIDTSPVLFVKIGQEQVGAIDFRILASNNTIIRNADTNVYDIDPFNNPLSVVRSTKEEYTYPVKTDIQKEEVRIDPPVFTWECS